MEQIQTEELFSHRESFKAMITSHIETFDSGVYCISARWGMGKTFLINKIIDEFPKGKKPLYFDAWKYDKYRDPLAALYMGLIVGENKELIKNFKENSQVKITKIHEELTQKTGMKFKIPVFSTGIETTTSEITNEETNVSQLVEKTFDINKCYHDLAEVLKDEGAVLIIDELDRANPHFTISMLEVIKHFFQEVSIYLVTDRVVLADIVNNYYGFKNGFDYLEKIVDDTFLLPEVPEREHLKDQLFNQIFMDRDTNSIFCYMIRENLSEFSTRQLNQLKREEVHLYRQLISFGVKNKQRVAYIVEAELRITKIKNFTDYYSIISNVKSNDIRDLFIERCVNSTVNYMEIEDEETVRQLIIQVLPELVALLTQ